MKIAYLEHHGVKGQKWGVRRNNPTLKKQMKVRKKYSKELAKKDKDLQKKQEQEDYDKARSRKDLDSMSDKDLQQRINRIRLEKEYKRMTEKEYVTAAKKYLSTVGKAVLAATVTAAAVTYAKKGSSVVSSILESKIADIQWQMIVKNIAG